VGAGDHPRPLTVEQFTHKKDRLIALSDRDYGLSVFDYTGPGSDDRRETGTIGTTKPLRDPLPQWGVQHEGPAYAGPSAISGSR
jgi:hypothetical protein